MWFPLVAFGLLMHVLFWGAGLAMLAMPRSWRHFWPVAIAPAGFALQSLVVWLGAYANLRGTHAYAAWSELLPALLLVAGCRRLGTRAAVTDLGRFGLVFAATGASLGLLVVPLVFVAKGLTTVSLGSCDAADYAAGARVLQEFARSDRGGFLGLTEVVQVMSVDNFFDFWLRLNHFTPSAVIALNGTILGCAPYELTSVMTAVLLASSLPLVFWVARGVMRYSGGVSLAIAALYGISPITWYAFAHVAMGQLLAAQGIALVTWAGIALWNARLTWRRAGAMSGALAIGYTVLLGSYNFILLVALVPALAYAGGWAIWRRQGRRFAHWCAALLMPLAGCGLIFFARTAGLVERFRLFRAYDFGWKIPAFTPEGWLGMVSGPELQPWIFAGLRWLLALLVLTGLVIAFGRAIAQMRRSAWTAACLCVPVLAGYYYLELRGARLGTNASYDAYKLFAVFYPLLLPAVCWWVTVRRSRRLGEWLVVVTFAGVVAAFNLGAAGMFMWRVAQPPLVVDRELLALRKIEAMPEVSSVNVLLPDMWSRLWANVFLLRRPQYFATHTYEGRLNTPLRGEWNLEGGLITVRLPEGGSREIAPHLTLTDTRSPRFLRAELGTGWHEEERIAKTGERWRWSKNRATVRFDNPQSQALTVVCMVDWRGLGARPVECEMPGGKVTRFVLHAGERREKATTMQMSIPPGRSEWVLNVPSAEQKTGGDARELGVCLFGLTVDVLP